MQASTLPIIPAGGIKTTTAIATTQFMAEKASPHSPYSPRHARKQARHTQQIQVFLKAWHNKGKKRPYIQLAPPGVKAGNRQPPQRPHV